MKIKNLSILLTAALLSITAAQAQSVNDKAPDKNPQSGVGGLLISPLLQRQAVHVNQKTSIDFKMENPETVRDSSVLEILPFTMEDWTYKTVYGDSGAHACSGWFTQKAQTIVLDAGAKQEVHLAMSVPADATGPYWCMLKVSPRPLGSITKSLVVYEIPVVLIVGNNPRPALKVYSPIIKRFTANDKSTMMSAILPVENTSDGFTIIGATGTLRSIDTGRILRDFILDDRNLMPGTKRQMSFLMPNLTDGRYRLEFRAIMGTRSLQAVSADYVVSKGDAVPASEATAFERSPISIEPSALNVSVPREGSRTLTVKITNNSEKPIKAEFSAKPLEQTKSGAIGLGDGVLPAGIELDHDYDGTPLDPKETRLVQIHVTVSPDAQGDIWFGLAAKDTESKTTLAESIFCTITVPTTQAPMLKLENATVVKDGDKNLAIKFDIHNSGNVALRPEPTGSVLENGVRLVDRISVPIIGDGGLLPGKTVSCEAMLPPHLKPGSHIVEFSYQYGLKDFATLRVPITVKAPVAPKTAKGGK